MTKREEDATEPPIDRRIKILSMGDGGVGKSCLIKRYCEGKFVSRYISTIGVDFGVKPVKIRKKTVKVNFWDLSGQPEFFEIRNEFYSDSQGVMIVFDVTSRASFEALPKWLEEAKKFGIEAPQMVLCGNKCDKAKRVVTDDEAQLWANEHDIEYFTTSAKSGENIQDMFMHLFAQVFNHFWPAKGKRKSGSRRKRTPY